MIAGIDIGGTNTQGVLLDGGDIKSFISAGGNGKGHVIKCYNFLKERAGDKPLKLALTGGGARRVKKSDLPIPFRVVDEIEAIGKGGAYLSDKNDVFVVSIGTGTAMVAVKDCLVSHPGGSGIGGGTISGLSRLILDTSVSETERMAKKGDRRRVDLTVGDIVGGDLGGIPSHATAANFGRLSQGYRKEDVAASMLNMIAESLGITAFFAAKNYGLEKNILICGRVAMNGTIKNRITETIQMLGGNAIIPKNAEYCAAIGAAVSLS